MPEDRTNTSVPQPGSDGETDSGQPVQPVPAPGHRDSSAGPGVRTAQGASPQDGVHAGEKSPGSDASVSSPGAWTALAAPGSPDGEVDTRP